MAENINDLISRAQRGGTVMLPAGEFEGPVYITKPLRLVGQNTTIWTRRGSVIEITCEGAAVESLRAELTESDVNEAAVVTKYPAQVRDVEIVGAVKGFGAEDGCFDVPKTIALGDIAPREENSFLLTVNVPVQTQIRCDTAGVTFTPQTLPAGRSELEIKVSGMSAQTFLYAEALFCSSFIRRVYITGRAAANAAPVTGREIYKAPLRSEPAQGEAPQETAAIPAALAAPATDVITLNEEQPLYDMPLLELRKGQRVGLRQYIGGACEIRFTCEKPAGMDIDPYVFELDGNERSFADRGLIFFGNESGANDEARYYPDDGRITLDLDRLDHRVQRISVVYSVYAGGPARSFAQVKNARVAISARGRERIAFALDGLTSETTIVAIEIYLYKGEWKLCAVGAGYRDGMARLCNHYGIEVEQ